ncbi:hypothetical protein CHARACLAT_011552 [Characodon lateralis]|uniref:Uncharacterized protein n=1 Tax=Characodon lateralis TaxID=208331 RepID=A0ABU7DFZ0_9TELE|nr:hypothetical protein [Characodon lateralis]
MLKCRLCTHDYVKRTLHCSKITKASQPDCWSLIIIHKYGFTAKLEHMDSPICENSALPLRSPLSLLRSQWAGRVHLCARYQNKQRCGWKRRVHTAYSSGRMREPKTTGGHEGDTGEYFLSARTCIQGEHFHFNALKDVQHHINAKESSAEEKKKSNPVCIRCTFP